MEYNEHLVEAFCISKPQFNPIQLTESDLIEGEPNDEQKEIKQMEVNNRQKSSPSCPGGKKNFIKIFDMIRKQINCSTAVTIDEKPKQQIKKQKNGVNNRPFIHQFEQFFKGFIKQPVQSDTIQKRKRASKKKTTAFKSYQNRSIEKQNNENQFEEEEDLRYTLDEQKLQQQKKSYYERMKAKLQHKVQPLVNKEKKNRANKHCSVEMSSLKDHDAVKTFVNDKEKFRKNDPLRLSRTGLTIRLSQIQRQIKGTNLTMIQDHKAKKDMLFQKSLFKNCHAILSDIESYQQTMADREKKGLKSSTSFHTKSSQVLRKTDRRIMTAGKSRQPLLTSEEDLDKLKWQQKYLSIEYQCQSYYQKSKNVRGGLKVFKRYCNKLSNKFKSDSQNLRQALKTQDQNDEDHFSYEALTKLDRNKISTQQSQL